MRRYGVALSPKRAYPQNDQLTPKKGESIEATRHVSPDYWHVLRRRADRRLKLRPGAELNHAAGAVRCPEARESMRRCVSDDDPQGVGLCDEPDHKNEPARRARGRSAERAYRLGKSRPH